MEEDLSISSSAFRTFFASIKRFKYVVIIFWLCCLVWGGLTGEDYIKMAEDTATAPHGTRTFDDYEAFKQYFPDFANQKMLILVIECLNPGCKIVCPASKCAKHCAGEDTLVFAAVETIAERVLRFPFITSYQSYYNFSNTILDEAKCAIASEDGTATFATFTFANEATNPQRHTVINELLGKIIPENNPSPENYRFSVTGFDALAKDGSEDAIKEVVKIDLFTMPVAFAFLGWMLRSWKLLLLAGMNTAITMAFSFAFLAQISKWTGKKPLSTSSSLVEVLGLAMAIDYSLFLLRRFRDEIKNSHKPEAAIQISLANAGHVVVLSSLTFSCVFVGFLFLPSADLQSLAHASLASILTALVVCMTNTAAMLLTFPDYFAEETPVCASCRRLIPTKQSNESDRVAADLYNALIVSDAVPSRPASLEPLQDDRTPDSEPQTPGGLGRTVTGKLRHKRGAKYSGCYFNFLKLVTKFPFNLIFILVVYSLSIPVALRVLDLEHNQDVRQAISRSAPSSKAYRSLSAAFPGGTLSPFYVVMESDSALLSSKEGPATFKAIHKFVDLIIAETGINPQLIVSPATLQGKKLDYSAAKRLLDSTSLFCSKMDPSACALYSYLYHRYTSTEGHAVLIMFTIDDNPYGEAGASFIRGCLEAIDSEVIDTTKYRLHLSGDEVLLNADQNLAINALPTLLATTITIIFILLGFGFKSFMTPVRLSLTVVLPLTTVFGFAVLVYQDGILNFTGIEAVQSVEQGFFWYIPIVCLLQALGLTIDYDVFTFSRVHEHRSDGYEIRAAIIKAVWEVSSTIWVAGIIMASVFSGLLLGSSTAVNQFGFILCMSVLVDTFIVQSLLVPAIVSLGDSVAWFPARMPTQGLITLEDREFAS